MLSKIEMVLQKLKYLSEIFKLHGCIESGGRASWGYIEYDESPVQQHAKIQENVWRMMALESESHQPTWLTM
jgi:hypothetical protein